MNFFQDPKNQAIASWIQTVVVVIGVFIALAQLSQISETIMLEKNERYLKFLDDYQTEIIPAKETIYANYRLIKDARLAPDFVIDKESVISSRKVIDKYLKNLDQCVTLDLCPEESVSDLICRLSTSMYVTLERINNYNGSLGFPQVGVINYHRNNYCGFFRLLIASTWDLGWEEIDNLPISTNDVIDVESEIPVKPLSSPNKSLGEGV